MSDPSTRFKQRFTEALDNVERAHTEGDIRAIVICIIDANGNSEFFHAWHNGMHLQVLGVLALAQAGIERLVSSRMDINGGQF